MPYIKKEDRLKFKDTLTEVIGILEENGTKVGEINYVISTIIWELFKSNPSYTTANNLIGVLECVKQEFYRRQISPLEDTKKIENGDIAQESCGYDKSKKDCGI